MIEVWKDIIGWEGLYRISNLARVESLPKRVGTGFRDHSIILKHNVNRHGYVYYILQDRGRTKTLTVHQLVARHFIPNPNNRKFVNHIDGNKLNNQVDNLEWCTSKENIHHAIKMGLFGSVGEANHNAKLTPEQVLEIFKSSEPINEIVNQFNISKSQVIDIRRGRRWSHITGLTYKPKRTLAEYLSRGKSSQMAQN